MITINLSTIDAKGGPRIAVDAPPTYFKRVESLPGAKYSRKDGVWTVSRAYQSVNSLMGMAKETGAKIIASPDIAAWSRDERAQWQELAALSTTLFAEDTPDHLYPHQAQDVAWLTYPGGPPGRLLTNEMGIGKTRSVLYALDAAGAYPALVVCPKTVVRMGWAKQIADLFPNLRVVLADGTAAKRAKALKLAEAGEADIVVVGWETMRSHTRFESYGSTSLKRCQECGGPQMPTEEDQKLAEAEGLPPVKGITAAACQVHIRELNRIPWKAIVGDEAHRILSTQSATRMAFSGLLKYTAEGAHPRRWLLTGTPMRSRPEGIWSLLNTVDPEGFPVKTKWIDRYCEMGWDNNGFETIVGYKPERKAEMDRTLLALSRRVLKAEALSLPPKLRGGSLIHTVTMGTEQRAAYDQMRDQMRAMVKEGKITAKSAMNAVGRLTLMSSATGYPHPDNDPNDPDKPEIMLVRAPSAKLDELVAMIRNEELVGQWAMAFSSRRFLELCVAELIKRDLYTEEQIGIIAGGVSPEDRFDRQQAFQSGDLPVMAYTHAAGGVGIDLYMADNLVLMERSWDPVVMAQSIDRVHRAGMPDRAVNIIDIITEGTVEDRQIERLDDAAALADEITHDSAKLLALLG